MLQKILADYSAGLNVPNVPNATQPVAAVTSYRTATPPTAVPSHPYTNGLNASYPQDYGAAAVPQANYSGYPAAIPAIPAPMTNALPESLASLPDDQKVC